MEVIVKKKSGFIIDWNNTNLLITDDENLIVMSNGKSSGDSFEGTVVKSNSYHITGKFLYCWVKSEFKPFQGEITLKS